MRLVRWEGERGFRADYAPRVNTAMHTHKHTQTHTTCCIVALFKLGLNGKRNAIVCVYHKTEIHKNSTIYGFFYFRLSLNASSKQLFEDLC